MHVDVGHSSLLLLKQNIASGVPHTCTRQEEHFGQWSVERATLYENDRMETCQSKADNLLSVQVGDHRSLQQSQSDSVWLSFQHQELLEIDALVVNWTGIPVYAYAFPPPILVRKLLKKESQGTCVVLLVAPFSIEQSYDPVLLELLVFVKQFKAYHRENSWGLKFVKNVVLT